jgi:hypothetical protein
MQRTFIAITALGMALAASPAALAQAPAKPAAATPAGPAIDLDRASFDGPIPDGAVKNAEAAKPMVAAAFASYLKQGAPAKARKIKRLRLTWGGGATEPVAWVEGDALMLQYFWDGAPKRNDVTRALSCAVSPEKKGCDFAGD